MKKNLIGAHISASGGAHNALYRGENIKANVIQLFTANQRRWDTKPISDKDIELFEEARKKTKISHIASHSSYLINLGSPDQQKLKKSIDSFKRELQRCNQLKIDYLIFHPGSAITFSEKECLEQIVKTLLSLKNEINKSKTLLLLETTAGQGTNIGYKFEHLGYIIQHLSKKIKIGVCIDTCHIFAAGYDIKDTKGWTKTLKEFDKKVGLKYLKAFHLNDSLKELGSRKDRHANIGKGKIGLESFNFLMKYYPDIPKYLETPVSTKWADEIALLTKLSKG